MKKKSFFEKLTSIVKINDDDNDIELSDSDSDEEESDDVICESEAQLAVDMYQTPSEIIIKTMVAGTKPEDLDINITRDMVIIKGKREEESDDGDDFFHKELYWGCFSRTIILPQEIDVEEAEALNKNGLLTIRLPKLDKNRQAKLKVKNS